MVILRVYKEVTLTMDYDQAQRSMGKITHAKFTNAVCMKKNTYSIKTVLRKSYVIPFVFLVSQPNEDSLDKMEVFVNKKWTIVSQLFKKGNFSTFYIFSSYYNNLKIRYNVIYTSFLPLPKYF